MHEHCAGMFVTQAQMQIRSSAVSPQKLLDLSVKEQVYTLFYVCFFFLSSAFKIILEEKNVN